MKYFSFGLLFVIAVSVTSCFDFFNKPAYTRTKQWALKPVYSADMSYRSVSYTPDIPVTNAGKIYVKDNYIYQCEVGSGIHVTDNTDPATARRIGFIKVPGCEEISIKGNILYTNNYYDLVSVDISTLESPKIISRTKDAFFGSSGWHTWEQPKDPGPFQCPDRYNDSVIVGWVMDSVYANCYK